MSKSTIRFAIWIAVGISIAAATLASVWWRGGYNVAADDAHSSIVLAALTSIR